MIAGMGDQIDILKFGENVPNLIEFSVCITNY